MWQRRRRRGEKKSTMVECTKNDYETQRRVIKYPSYLTLVKTGEILVYRTGINYHIETSYQCFLISLGRYQQEFHSAKHLANLMPILHLTKLTRRTTAHWPRGHFQIGDKIRTWRTSQSSIAVSLDVIALTTIL